MNASSLSLFHPPYIPTVHCERSFTGSGHMILSGKGLEVKFPSVLQSNPEHVKMQQVAGLQARDGMELVVSQDASGLRVAPCMAPQSTPELTHGMKLGGVVQQRSGFGGRMGGNRESKLRVSCLLGGL